MRVALGCKAHSGWAAVVAIGVAGGTFSVVDRRRIELVSDRAAEWAGQPYHAAAGLPPAQARSIIEHGIADARRMATAALTAAIEPLRQAGHVVVTCAVVMPAPMPDWTIEQILAVHVRMHKAEGVLFPGALADAAGGYDLQPVAIPEKELDSRANSALSLPQQRVSETIAVLGKSVGPPWGADQKKAALAAVIALSACLR